MTFSSKVIAITGAASGIGRGLALELASRGADLAICDVDEKGLTETAKAVEQRGRKVTSDRVDVSDREAVFAFAGRAIDHFGQVHGIVNNAGVAVSDSVLESTFEDLEWIFGINLWGVIHGTKAFLPHLVENDDGWVVNLSSVFGIIGVPYQSAYNATKFAVRGYTEALRQELHGSGVSATCVHPGGIKTNIARSSRFRRGGGDAKNSEEAALEFEKIARTTSEEAAKIIADGMAERAERVLVGMDARAIDVVQRLAPVRYDVVLRQLFG